MLNDFTLVLLDSDGGILETIFKIASIIGVVILVCYTIETYKLRKNSDKQLISAVRPVLIMSGVLDFLKTHDTLRDMNEYDINCYNNIALNIYIFIKEDEKRILNLKFPLKIIESNNSCKLHVDDFYQTEKVVCNVDEIKNYINLYNWQCVLIYQDIGGRMLFTLIYRKSDEESVMETKYLDEIK